MNTESLDETKKIIRSLLISAKQGLYVVQLERDYKYQKGTPIPYLEFGHSTLESFLTSMPDVVHISRKGRLLHLTGIATNETSHIARMVQLQTGGTTSIAGTADSQQSRNRQKLYMSNSKTSAPRTFARVPDYICKQLREILLSYPNGIELGSFPNAYQKRFGHGLQYMRLGYSSINNFIRAVPGVTTVMLSNREYVIYSTTVARKLSPTFDSPPGFSSSDTKYPTHPYTASEDSNALATLDKIESRQETPPVSDDVTPLSEDPLPPDIPPTEPTADANTDDTVEVREVGVLEEVREIEELGEQGQPPVEEGSPDPNLSPPSTPGTSVSCTLPLIPHRKPLNQATQLAMHKQKQGQNMYDKLSREISDLLSDLPEVTPLEELEVAYQARYGFEIPYQEFGFSSPRELVESHWNLCRLEQREYGVFVRRQVSDKVQTTELVTLDDYAYGCPRVDPEIGLRVRNLLLKWPSGMPLSLLLGKYRDAYGEELKFEELGFDEPLYLMLAIPDCVRLTPWSPDSSTTDYILHGLPLTNEELEGQVLPAPSKPAPCDDVTLSYDKQPVPQSWEFTVYLPFISNPDRFWIQVVGPKTTEVVEHMLDKMTNFYNSLTASSLPDFLLASPRLGQSCAAPYQRDGYYYRSKILRFPQPDEAEVYYVDYGNKSRVQISCLRRIEINDLILPAQAIRCRLANVRPVANNRWPPGSANKIKDLTNNMELLCKVQNIESDDTLSVHLYQPNSDTGQSINQALISCGIAVHEDNNTPLHPDRACLSPEESFHHMTSYPLPAPPPQDIYPPPLPHLHVPYNQPPPPGMMPPQPYSNIPLYPYPPHMNTPHPYMNPMVPPYPMMPLPPYQQTQTIPPPYNRSYLTASAPPPPPQISMRPTLNFQLPPPNSTKPVSLSDGSTMLQGDTYIFNETDNQALERLVEEKQPVLEKRDQFDLSSDMGAFEKVQKYLSTSKTPNEFEIQLQVDRVMLDQLNKSRENLVSKKFDMSNKKEFNHYLSELNRLSTEIDQCERKIAENLTLGSPTSPSPEMSIPPPIPEMSPSLFSGPIAPPLLTLPMPQPSAASIGASQNLDPHGKRIQFKYKGIGRGGKMSDLV